MPKQRKSKQRDAKQWDRLLKTLMSKSPQDLVSWILKGAIYQRDVNVELLKNDPIFADLLYVIEWRGEQIVLHIEFQREKDTNMGRRVWEYNCLASIHTELPVYSIVIYLLDKGEIVDPPYEIKLSREFTIHRFRFQNIKLWEIPGKILKQQKLPGLLPLLPLTKGGNSQEVVEEMIQDLEQAGRTDLLPLAYICSAYKFEGVNEQKWLIGRFDAMKGSLEDNYAYREMVKWAEEKSLKLGLKQGLEQGSEHGKKDGLKHSIVRFAEIRFPDLVPLAKQQAGQAANSQELQEIQDKLFAARSDTEAKAALLGEQA
jgi:predicted transposase YdaD